MTFQPRLNSSAPSQPDTHEILLAELEEVERSIAALRGRLISSDGARKTERPEYRPSQIRGLLKARAARNRFIADDIFADPAWDILLEAYAASLEDRSTSVTALCAASAVPNTTALRWINRLREKGLLRREDDVRDQRRGWIAISPQGAVAMRAYLDAIAITLPL